MNRISLILIFMLASSSQAFARELREYSFDELVKSSEIIATVKVLGIESRAIEHGQMRLAKFQVIDAHKGTKRSEIAYLVLEDAIIEKRPNCCKAGKLYLIFGTRGAQVLFDDNGQIRSKLVGRVQLVSSTNGRYSTYLVEKNTVIFWRHTEYSDLRNEYTIVKSSIARCVNLAAISCSTLRQNE